MRKTAAAAPVSRGEMKKAAGKSSPICGYITAHPGVCFGKRHSDSEVLVIGGSSGGHVTPVSPADSSFTKMLTQSDQFHLNQSFDHMVSLLGGEADVNWYPRSWNRIVTMREVMDQNISPLAVIPASLISGFNQIHSRSKPQQEK
jgi:hypothetical protein